MKRDADPGLAAMREELLRAGLDKRLANIVVLELGFRSIADFCQAEWGSRQARAGLAWRLALTPRVGDRGVELIGRAYAVLQKRLAEPEVRE